MRDPDPPDVPAFPTLRGRDLIRPRGPRDRLRGVALSLLGSGPARLGPYRAALGRPRLQVLNLHHVLPDEEDGFRELLGWLRRTGHRLVGYGEGLDRLRADALDAPLVAFTFDDGLAAGLAGARILEEFGGRACFFLVTSMVGETDPGRVERFCRTRIHMAPGPFLGWADVDDLLARGHEIGSHTHRHPVCADEPRPALREDLAEARATLTARVGGVRHFSWPYGRWRHFSAGAARDVFDAGFESCASAERGAHGPPGRPLATRELCVRRDHAMGAWPLSWHRWFVGRSALRARPGHHRWPDGWHDRIVGEDGA